MNRKYTSNLSFIDMLFNVLIGFVMLFIIAFLMINPITKKNDIPSKAEFMLILEWDSMSVDDIDVWIKSETGHPVSFKLKNVGYWHLDRDDLGTSNDITMIDGQPVVLRSNREIATMRGVQPGDTFVNVHIYSKRDAGPTKFTVTLIDVNPYKEVYVIEHIAEEQNQRFVLPAFTVDSDGRITDVFTHDEIFAAQRPVTEMNWGGRN